MDTVPIQMGGRHRHPQDLEATPGRHAAHSTGRHRAPEPPQHRSPKTAPSHLVRVTPFVTAAFLALVGFVVMLGFVVSPKVDVDAAATQTHQVDPQVRFATLSRIVEVRNEFRETVRDAAVAQSLAQDQFITEQMQRQEAEEVRAARDAENARIAEEARLAEEAAAAEAERAAEEQRRAEEQAAAEAAEEEDPPVDEPRPAEPNLTYTTVASISNSAGPVNSWTQSAANAVVSNVPGAAGITLGGTRGSAVDPAGHPSGNAIDYMVMGDAALGDAIVQYHIDHWNDLGVDYIIWQQRYMGSPGEGWSWMEDRGSITANHYDHAHVNYAPR